MNYKPRDGIVLSKICGMNVLIPSRSASKYCSTILPLNSFGFLVWKSISEDDSIEKILDMCRIFSRRTDEENTNRIEAFTKALYEKGFIVLKDTEEG